MQRRQQCASAVFMVRSAAFGFNVETAASNAFQAQGGALGGALLGGPVAQVAQVAEVIRVNSLARAESAGLQQALESEGIRVIALDDSAQPSKPDAVFPNNWVSFHHDGTLVLYPMLAPIRRLERRAELVEALCARLNFRARRQIDLTAHERAGRYLEGTGSLVLDHVGRIAYACRSPRTDESLVREWARLMDYEPIVFDATDAFARPYYHTNVVMWIGTRCAMIGSTALAPADRQRVCAKLRDSGRELFEVDRDMIAAFAGNMLELASWDEALGDCSVLVMSVTAQRALAGPVWQRLSGCVDTILTVPVPTIERIGGGSVRCMLAEVPEIVWEPAKVPDTRS